VSYARDRSYEREAVTDERDISRDALRRGMGETTYGQVRRVFEGRLEAGEFQQVSSSKHITPTTRTGHGSLASRAASISASSSQAASSRLSRISCI
jgi:hypothetical protein